MIKTTRLKMLLPRLCASAIHLYAIIVNAKAHLIFRLLWSLQSGALAMTISMTAIFPEHVLSSDLDQMIIWPIVLRHASVANSQGVLVAIDRVLRRRQSSFEAPPAPDRLLCACPLPGLLPLPTRTKFEM